MIIGHEELSISGMLYSSGQRTNIRGLTTMRQVLTITRCLLILSLTITGSGISALAVPTAADTPDAFSALTAYVARQVQSDKIVFVAAQRCTEWFYKELKRKPPRAPTHTITLTPIESDVQSDSASECQTRYPEGLDSARQAFSHAQSALSISLTFYELVLIGDRDDNYRYNEDELKDLLESFKLPFQDMLPAIAYVDTLTAQFDLARRGNTLEAVMASMGTLYEKGYRLTTGDRVALNHLSR